MSRSVGLAIAGTTALVVLAVGSLLLPPLDSAPKQVAGPPIAQPPPPPAELPPAPPPAPAVTVGLDAAAATDASSAPTTVAAAGAEGPASATDAALIAQETSGADADPQPAERPSGKKRDRDRDKDKDKDKDQDKASTRSGETSKRTLASRSKQENAPLPPSDGTATDPGKDAIADCNLSDKDIAREAWRRNWPTVCPTAAGDKAFIVIPLKGSLEGEVHEHRQKPNHEARVVLPAGSESQLTMKQYKVHRLGFKDVRIGSMEDGRIRLRVRLEADGAEPTFEIKDGYAKVTIPAPPAQE